jgi:hypothetical protein
MRRARAHRRVAQGGPALRRLAGAGWLVLLLVLPGAADAASRCTFVPTGSTWTLDADCVTDRSLVVPDGITLDGAHHTIAAIDPAAGGFFRGAVIVNGGASANVTNLTITALMLEDVCQAGNDRLRAISFTGAGGVIRGNTIINVNKAGSSCQEGNSIEVVNRDPNGPAVGIEISNNVIDGFQKTGILVSGNVDVAIRGNIIGASAAQVQMAANGIQVGNGARADIDANTVAGNAWDVAEPAAAGTAILLSGSAPGTVVRDNVITGNADVGIYVMANGARVERNRLTDSGVDGKYDIGIGNYGEDNVFEGNSIVGFRTRYQGVTESDTGTTTVAARE